MYKNVLQRMPWSAEGWSGAACEEGLHCTPGSLKAEKQPHEQLVNNAAFQKHAWCAACRTWPRQRRRQALQCSTRGGAGSCSCPRPDAPCWRRVLSPAPRPTMPCMHAAVFHDQQAWFGWRKVPLTPKKPCPALPCSACTQPVSPWAAGMLSAEKASQECFLTKSCIGACAGGAGVAGAGADRHAAGRECLGGAGRV